MNTRHSALHKAAQAGLDTFDPDEIIGRFQETRVLLIEAQGSNINLQDARVSMRRP